MNGLEYLFMETLKFSPEVRKIKNGEKCVFFLLIWGHFVANFYNKTAFSPRKTPLDHGFINCWTFPMFWSSKSLENLQKLHKKVKNRKFFRFRSQFGPLFQKTFCVYVCTKASRATNWFLFERFEHSKLPGLSNVWPKMHKNVENLKFSEFFFNFDLLLRHFSLKTWIYSFEKATWTPECFPVQTFSTF